MLDVKISSAGRTWLWVLLVTFWVIGGASWSVTRAAEEPKDTARDASSDASSGASFGFAALEIYRASDESRSLRVHDVNVDGLPDLVFAFNTDTSIRILYQKDAAARAETSVEESLALNEVPYDDRFRSEKIYTEKDVYGLAIADLNSDDLPDIAYYGNPSELVVHYQGKDWKTKVDRFPITDGLQTPHGLKAVDIDRDGKRDLVLLGAGKTYILKQELDPDSGEFALGQPEVFYNSARKAFRLDVVDIDGDGRLDLVTVAGQESYPITVRLQRHQSFGPEIRVKMMPLTDVAFRDVDGDGKVELLAIQGNTRRVLVYRWGTIEKPSELALREPRFVSFRPDGAASSRRVAFGDVNGDERSDMVVTYGDLAEADVSLQGENGELLPPVRSPMLSDVQGVVVGNFDGQPGNEIVVVSVAEKVVGRSRWLDEGRLSIPQNESLAGADDSAGEPLLVDKISMPSDVKTDTAIRHDAFAVLLRIKSGQYRLQVLSYDNEGRLVTHGKSDMAASAQPKGLMSVDLDGNGYQDLIVFVPYGNPKVYLVDKSESDNREERLTFREVSSDRNFGISQLAKLDPSAVTVGDFPLPNDEETVGAPGARHLVIASKSHARALRLDTTGRLRIVEQFSGRGTSANIQGVLAVNLDADEEPEVLTYDKGANAIDLLDRGDRGIYRRVRTIDMLGFSFEAFRATDVDGDARLDVVVQGRESVAVLLRGRDVFGLVQCAEFDPGDESHGRVEDFGKPYLITTGDLNADGRLDLCYMTQPRYYMTVLQSKGDDGVQGILEGKLTPEFRFQIFEEKSYMRSNQGYGPKQITVRDVTGDGKEDLLLLIHDRILLYVQE